MPEVKQVIQNIENLKTSTGIKEEKEGDAVNLRLITKVQFEAEMLPGALADIHRLLASGAPVHAILGSSQPIMELAKQEEPVFAET